MSNLERDPQELTLECPPAPEGAPEPIVYTPREVPLGGPRAMNVRRTLPSRGRTMIGAWCFLDHYGPDQVEETGRMRIPPHPHTGLQTVSWLFAGEIEHRDSVGSRAQIHPGEVNLMTAGSGISHSETSTATTTVLHGVQLWVALPDAQRFTSPFFESAAARLRPLGAGTARIFIGALAGEEETPAAVTTFTPLLAAQLDLDSEADVELPIDPAFEHGILVDAGSVRVEGADVARFQLVYLAPGRTTIRIRSGDAPCRLLLIGGEPLREQILMWWNFVGRTHEEIVEFRRIWQEQIQRRAGEDAMGFGDLAAQDYDGSPLPAPALPSVRLRPRD